MIYILIILLFFGATASVSQKTPDALKISGNQIVRVGSNKPIILKGIGLGNGVFNNKGGGSEKIPSWALTEKDVIFLKKLGCNVVRYCFSYKWFLKDKNFMILDKHLALLEKHGIYVFLNMHIPPGSGTKYGETISDELFAKENWKIFLNVWKKIVKRYKGRAIIAAYEPLSEPKPQDYEEMREKTNEILSLIRQVEKGEENQHIVIIANPEGLRKDGKTIWGQYPFFKVEDDNILYTFHFYKPWEFTGQPEYKTEKGSFFDKKMLAEKMEDFIVWAQKENVPLYLGEFGVINRAALSDRIRWTKYVLELISRYKITAWTYWNYKKDYSYRYDWALLNVYPDDFSTRNDWERNHFKNDIIKVNSMNEKLFNLLKSKMKN